MGQVTVEVRRGSMVESVHRVHVVECDGDGSVTAHAGDAHRPTFARSAIKPIQALPLVQDGAAARFGLTPEEIAVCCGSHNGASLHVEAARSILAKAGVSTDALACGPQVPRGDAAREMLRAQRRSPERVHNNCSGKHAGMLALAQHHGWPVEGYHELDHPVQDRIATELGSWIGRPAAEIPTAVDGCGIPTFRVELAALAGAFARLALAAAGEQGAPATVMGAMVRHPEYVAGEERLCTDLMRAARGSLFVKFGAEGVYCAGVPAAGRGIALKVEDGARRASEPALLGVLDALGHLPPGVLESLDRYAEPGIENTRGEVVGSIRTVVHLDALRAVE